MCARWSRSAVIITSTKILHLNHLPSRMSGGCQLAIRGGCPPERPWNMIWYKWLAIVTTSYESPSSDRIANTCSSVTARRSISGTRTSSPRTNSTLYHRPSSFQAFRLLSIPVDIFPRFKSDLSTRIQKRRFVPTSHRIRTFRNGGPSNTSKDVFVLVRISRIHCNPSTSL